MPITGERTVPGIPHENYRFRRHEAVYAAVPGFAPAPGVVVDAGSGEGCGTKLLARSFPPVRVLGLDYDPSTTTRPCHHTRLRDR